MKPSNGSPGVDSKDLARRNFFRTLAVSGAGFVLAPKRALSASTEPDEQDSDKSDGPGLGFFNELERKALGSLTECILPKARELGAVDYIEQLLTAFEYDPPRVFAGGPFSGRTPFPTAQGTPSTEFPPNTFKEFLPLNRVQRMAWLIKIYGSDGVQGGAPNDALLGKTKGLRDIFKAGLKEALKLSFGATDRAAMELVYPVLPADFRDTLRSMVIESAYAPPEYGGNREAKSWEKIHFDGDSLPLGFSMYDETTQTYREREDAPVSGYNPGVDPDKMTWFTRLSLRVICLVLGGRTFK